MRSRKYSNDTAAGERAKAFRNKKHVQMYCPQDNDRVFSLLRLHKDASVDHSGLSQWTHLLLNASASSSSDDYPHSYI